MVSLNGSDRVLCLPFVSGRIGIFDFGFGDFGLSERRLGPPALQNIAKT